MLRQEEYFEAGGLEEYFEAKAGRSSLLRLEGIVRSSRLSFEGVVRD